jgi:NDP-sugar pyrophosphorylase family protein
MQRNIRTVILAGGKGTRLRPYTTTLPKPLVPVGDRAILEIVIEQLRQAGVGRVTMAVSHLAQLLQAYFGTGERYGLAIDYSLEDSPLGTMGPLRLIQDLPESFLVMNGDVLTDLDFARFWREHQQSGALASVCVYRRTIRVDFGVLEVTPDNFLCGFREKPEVTHMVSMGVYAFRRDVLQFIPPGKPFGFDDLMLALLARKIPVRCHPHTGQWLDIGRPSDYELAQTLCAPGVPPPVENV